MYFLYNVQYRRNRRKIKSDLSDVTPVTTTPWKEDKGVSRKHKKKERQNGTWVWIDLKLIFISSYSLSCVLVNRPVTTEQMITNRLQILRQHLVNAKESLKGSRKRSRYVHYTRRMLRSRVKDSRRWTFYLLVLEYKQTRSDTLQVECIWERQPQGNKRSTGRTRHRKYPTESHLTERKQ